MRFFRRTMTISASIALVQFPAAAVRTVTAKEIGLLFQNPNGFTLDQVGAFVAPATGATTGVTSDALKIMHGRAHIFMPADTSTWCWFPYSNFQTFAAQQAAAGHPLFVTATYAGKQRPVYFGPSLGLDANNKPTVASTNWRQLVNVADSNFVNYWVNTYVRPIAWKNVQGQSNVWIGADECYFLWVNYGVLNDNGVFVSNLPSFDSPFPQNESQFLTMLGSFFHQLKAVTPTVNIMPNLASNLPDRMLTDPSTFGTLYADVPGIMVENIYDPETLDFSRGQMHLNLMNINNFGAQGKIALLRANMNPGDTTGSRTALILYLLMRGDNFFYAPNLGLDPSNDITAENPSDYMPMRTALGDPIGPIETQLQSGQSDGYRLYWRACAHGIIYLNWTGVSQTITLPHGVTFADHTGKTVATLTIPDLTGDYVTTSQSVSGCDLNSDGLTNVQDIQLAVNQALGSIPCTTANLTEADPPSCTAVAVQRVVNAVLGSACKIGL